MQSQYNLMMEGVDVKDPKTMESVAFDGKSIGEIIFRGNTLMLGYLENSKPAHEVFKGGWYRTGDLAVRHPDGYIQMKDRAGNIIICGGEVISTLEVEPVLEAAVVGKYDEVFGETPCAIVKLKEGFGGGVEASSREIIEFCEGTLPGFMVPKVMIFGEKANPVGGQE
ncbi:hypothetical protein PRUPE_7G178700 [Prunus persica]|uniref:AMP-binding enzyme C-terminal domain-containing protein n=1 Tax=Prunus persica TaxID=3760 RepID=M5W7T7_PRUPE|nr:hypothetical protein PRUPE_7G178700 [Prunus persica]